MKAITDAAFDWETKCSKQPVLVHFHSERDYRCLEMMARLKRINETHPGWVKLVSLNIDENHIVASKYRIRKVPVMMLFKGGSVELSMDGLVPEERLVSILERHI